DRHSNRGPYRNVPVSEDWLAAIGDMLDDDLVSLTWVTQAAAREQLGELMVAAAQAVVDDQQMSRDGFAWFRSSAAQITAHRHGLTLDGQGLSPLMTSAAKLLPPASRHTGDRFWVTQTREVHTATAAAYGLLLVADPHDPQTQLRGGRMLERVHLGATVRGLALQHMNQITERIDRVLSLGKPAVFAPLLDDVAGRPGRQVLAAFRPGHPTAAGRATPVAPPPR
ncbi:MAG: hypothetical protein SYR96_17565, partial [Actinomycetota bacterium]|nr:hypothetical protein [Actinomycetota bacterium]